MATRIDHIGSTSVPALAAKDVIDVQVSVRDDRTLRTAVDALTASGWTLLADVGEDHRVPGMSDAPSGWRKALLREPVGERRMNVHVRIEGRPNQRYALLFRDHLRSHPATAAAYGELKRRLAALVSDVDTYAEAKDPACDLIYLAAEGWAGETDWTPGPSGA